MLYVGSCADLGALRRRMEAHGAVTRSRLTPAVTAVVADPSVPADHPTLRTAATLGIPVLGLTEAIAQFAGWWTRTEPIERPVPNVARRSWSLRRRVR
jgi:UDP-N-acetylmuramoylalanine-D-glutamate ligase